MKTANSESDLKQFETEIYFKLREAEQEAESSALRYSQNDMLKAMQNALDTQLDD